MENGEHSQLDHYRPHLFLSITTTFASFNFRTQNLILLQSVTISFKDPFMRLCLSLRYCLEFVNFPHSW